MLKTLFVWLHLNSLVFTTFIQHKAYLVVLHVFLLSSRFSNCFLPTFSSFIKWPHMRSKIFLFLLNATAGLLRNTLQNSGMICRMCQLLICLKAFFCMLTLVICFLAVTFYIILQKHFSINQVEIHHLTNQIIFIIFSFQTFLFHTCAVPLVLILCRTYSFNLNVWVYAILFLMYQDVLIQYEDKIAGHQFSGIWGCLKIIFFICVYHST